MLCSKFCEIKSALVFLIAVHRTNINPALRKDQLNENHFTHNDDRN